MIEKPRFRKYFPIKAQSEGVFLLSERDSLEIKNHLYKLLAPLINGHHTVEEIVEEILPQLLPEKPAMDDFISAGVKAHYALVRMEQQGYIVESDDQFPPSLAVFCDHLNVNPKDAHRRLHATKVAVKAFGTASTEELISLLESLHIQVADEGDIEVVLTDDYLQPGLEEHNQNALGSNRAWMLIKSSGTIPWIGPIFQPGKTGCWYCLAHRLRENRPIENFIQKQQSDAASFPIPLATLNSTVQTTLNMAATEIFKWIVLGQNKELEGSLITYDALKLRMNSHALIKRPQCPSCGLIANGLNGKPLPIVLGRRKKTFVTDGGHRCVAPEETLRKYQHLIDPITGVVRSLQKVSPKFSPLFHSYVARHHCELTELEWLRINISGRSAGKGKTDTQARASALCESLERYSGVFQGDEIRYKNSYKQLGEQAIHPNACMNFSLVQYDNRHQWHESCSSFSQSIPEPFDEKREREWTRVWSLTHQVFKYLPTAYCYYGYPQQTSKADCWADSNGCAAGNTLEEAIIQGFMELVERDCVALWWYNRTKHPAIDLDSFDEPYFQALQDYYQTLQRDLWVIDITSDLNIPTFAAISRRTDSEVEDLVLGYGAHFDPVIAIGRALTEVNQILPAVLSSKADGTTQYLSYEPLAIEWWKTATVKNQPYLNPNDSLPIKVGKDYPRIWNNDLLDDIKLCQHLVEERGMEMLVLDQTRPDIGLKVVKVIVPGLRHFWRRLGSGRLYEVPVQLGWLDAPLTEEQLNPYPMWM
ncbi:TOMM precursor leader peptide-binding protein [Pleurocapsales cyanobacterium LEGE 10410]|nr:TOMM precursor leader peptide-binding protein [Pleurocapsales cyanobacterium LEGE 10410]